MDRKQKVKRDARDDFRREAGMGKEGSRSPWTCGKQNIKGEKQSFRREQEMV
jgi:hypothetical protein